MIIHSPIISGSLTFADGATFTLPDNGVYSGSFSGSIQVHEVKSDLIPDTSGAYDLGSEAYPFQDLWLVGNTINLGGIQIGKGIGGLNIKNISDNEPAEISAKSVTIGGILGGVGSKKFQLNANNRIEVRDENDTIDSIEVSEIILKDTSGNGRNTVVKNDGGKFTTQEVDNSGSVTALDSEGSLSGSFTGSIQDAVFNGDTIFSGSSIRFQPLPHFASGIAVTGSTSLENTTITGSIDVSGSISIKPTGDGLTNRLSFNTSEFHAKSPGFYWMTDSITIGSNDESTLFAALDSTRLQLRTLLSLYPVSTTPEDITAGTFAVSGSTPIYCDGVDWSSFAFTTGSIFTGKQELTGSLEVSGLISADGGIAVTGSIEATTFVGMISSSAQVDADSITNFDTNVKAKLDADGVISGSSQVNADSITNFDENVKTKLDADGVISGSSQVVYTSLSSIPSGIVSGSSQVNADSITNFDANVKTKLDADTVVSGSTQILTLVSIDEDTMSSNSDTKLPTQQSVKAYVDTEISALVSGSPATLDTLNELAAALGDDPNFATTISTTIGGKVSQSLEIISGDGLTGGGNLTTNRTLAVGAGDGISVAADSVAVDGTVLRTNGFGVVSGSAQINHDSTIGFEANEHIDWTADQGATNIHSGNYINTTYSVGDGGLTEINFTTARRDKLAGIADSANNYSLPEATSTVRGGIELFSNTEQSVAANAVSATADRTYGIQLNSAGQAVVNVPWVDTDTTYTRASFINQAVDTSSDVNFNTVNINATTASTTKTTGALIVDGGVGVAGALNVGGDVVAYASSDRRLKDNIVNIENPIEKVQKLNGVTWDWNSNADELQQSLPNVGVIAQEVEEVFPQLVHDRDNGYKGVDYAKLTGLLIEAIKEQQKQIDELKSKLN